MTTTTNSINWFITAGTLRAAFTQDKRQDGTLYWCLTEQARHNDKDLTPWLMGLHDDELPNDWRYETIVSILDALMDIDGRLADHDDHTDLVSGIVDNLTDVYNGALMQWYADIPSRVDYIEEGVLSGIITPEADTIARLMIGQTICIEQMAYRIIDRLLEGK
jgi:hypothetical protein